MGQGTTVFNDEKMFWIMFALLSTFFTITCSLGVYIWKDNKTEKTKDRNILEKVNTSLTDHLQEFALHRQKATLDQQRTDESMKAIKGEHTSIKRTLSYHGRQLKRHDDEINKMKE